MKLPEHRYSNTVYEQYVQNIMEIEKGLVELRLQLDVANGKDKKLLKAKIKEAEESVEAMKIATSGCEDSWANLNEVGNHLGLY